MFWRSLYAGIDWGSFRKFWVRHVSSSYISGSHILKWPPQAKSVSLALSFGFHFLANNFLLILMKSIVNLSGASLINVLLHNTWSLVSWIFSDNLVSVNSNTEDLTLLLVS